MRNSQEKDIREIDGHKINVTWFKKSLLYFKDEVIPNNEEIALPDLITLANKFALKYRVDFSDVHILADFEASCKWDDDYTVTGALCLVAKRLPTDEEVEKYVRDEVEKIVRAKELAAYDRKRKRESELELYKKLKKKFGKS
jgi:hypothetical protein